MFSWKIFDIGRIILYNFNISTLPKESQEEGCPLSLLTLFLLALGLSMDAFAVSISNGLCYKNLKGPMVVWMALSYGIFQALMPLIGYALGSTFSGLIESVDHWIAFILLGFIGGKMVVEAIAELRNPQEDSCPTGKILTVKTLLLQSIATSIDALAVGISLALMRVNLILSVTFIGTVTFVCCLIGGIIGRKLGGALKQKAEIFGGIVLVLIGVKILIEHLTGM